MAKSNLKKMCYVFFGDTVKRRKVTIFGENNKSMSFPGTFECELKKGIKKCNSDRGKKTKNREWIACETKKISCLRWKRNIFIRNEKGRVYMKKLDDIKSSISDIPRTPTEKEFEVSTGELVNGKKVIGIKLGVRPSNENVPFNLWFFKEDLLKEGISCPSPESLECSRSQGCVPTSIEQQQQQQVTIQQPEVRRMSNINQQGYPAQQQQQQPSSYNQEQNVIDYQQYQQGYPAQQQQQPGSYNQEQNVIYYQQYQQGYPAQQQQIGYNQEQNVIYYPQYQQCMPANAYFVTIYPPVY